jgi:hypothetical protein
MILGFVWFKLLESASTAKKQNVNLRNILNPIFPFSF